MLMLVVFAISTLLLAQNRIVSGRVTDEKGNGLSDVSIQVKGTPIGTVSTSDGSYSISVPSNERVLVFSSVDMGTQEMSIGNQTTIDTELKAANKSLQEVVVVAYGTQRKKDQTGSISTIGGQELENRPFSSFDKMLQGEISGLLSVAGSGQPGSTQNVRLRGIGSISAAHLYMLWMAFL